MALGVRSLLSVQTNILIESGVFGRERSLDKAFRKAESWRAPFPDQFSLSVNSLLAIASIRVKTVDCDKTVEM